MRTWSNYGKWRHPIQYHQIKLDHYFKVNYPDKVKLNPTIIHVEEGYIHYRMMNQQDQIRMEADRVIEQSELLAESFTN